MSKICFVDVMDEELLSKYSDKFDTIRKLGWHTIYPESANTANGTDGKMIILSSVLNHEFSLIEDHRNSDYNEESKIKSCFLRYTCKIVDGCLNKCDYCYSKKNESLYLYIDFYRKIRKELIQLDSRYPIYFGSSGEIFMEPIMELLDFNALFTCFSNNRLFFVTRYPENAIHILSKYKDLIKKSMVKLYVTFNYYDAPSDELFKNKLYYIKEINKNGFYCGLLYKPIIPGKNDSYSLLRKVFAIAKKFDIPEICTGFLISKNSELSASLGVDYALEYVNGRYIPAENTRIRIISDLIMLRDEFKIRLSFCHSFLPGYVSSGCLCKLERWS